MPHQTYCILSIDICMHDPNVQITMVITSFVDTRLAMNAIGSTNNGGKWLKPAIKH
jgi:hypothetical protein